MQEIPDGELAKLLGLSDYAAFEELHRRFWPKLQAIAYRKTGDRLEPFQGGFTVIRLEGGNIY